MNLYTKAVRYILLPIAAKAQKSNILNEYVHLEQTDWYTQEQLMALQNEKLQRLIQHCYKNVPYYTRIFNTLNLKPDNIKCLADLAKLPILTKQIIRDNYDDLISSDIAMRKANNICSNL